MSLARRVRRYLRQLGPYRAIADWQNDRRFRTWKADHPAGTHAEFYASRAEEKLRLGKHHYTLGTRVWVPGHGAGVELDEQSFAGRGLEIWNQIVAFGLEPHMRCVDYGCGSLRLGQHAIRYLDPGNYFGIDVVGTFIAEGLRLIPPELVARQKPRFGLINDETIADILAWQPDFIFSNAVLQHVPPDELPLYFQRLEAMTAPSTKAVVLFIAAARTERVKAMSWAYSTDDLLPVIARAAPLLQVDLGDVGPGIGTVDGRPRRVLHVRRSNA